MGEGVGEVEGDGDDIGAKSAVTDFAELIRTVHVEDVPEHAPDQPVKTKPELAVAVSATEVVEEYLL